MYHKKVKSKVNKPSTKRPRAARMLGIGPLNLTLTLTLTKEEIEENKWDITNLHFLEDHPEYQTRIILDTNSSTINFLLHGNKTKAKKNWVQYWTWSTPIYKEEFGFMEDIVEKITNEYSIFPIANKICDVIPEITVIIKTKDSSNSFSLVGAFAPRVEENAEKNNETSPDETGNTQENTNETNGNNNSTAIQNTKSKDKFDENEAKKLYKRIKNIEFADFDYIILDLEDFTVNPDITKEIQLDDIMYFFHQLKVTSNIQIILNYPNHFIPDISDSAVMDTLIAIFERTDIYWFDTDEAFKLFNRIYRSRNAEILKTVGVKQNISKQSWIKFFANEIVRKSKFKYTKKIALFLQDFKIWTIIEIPPLPEEYLYQEFNVQVYPKINHYNMFGVINYKNEIKSNFEMYKIIFFGSLIGKYIPRPMKEDIFLLSYLTAVENMKRMVEINLNKLDIPVEKDFFLVRLPNIEINKLIKNKDWKSKERTFTWDCENKDSSKIRNYCPFEDKGWHDYFAKPGVQKMWGKRQLISPSGYVCYDPFYKDTLKGGVHDKPTGEEFIEQIAHMKVATDEKKRDVFDASRKPIIIMSTKKVKLPKIKTAKKYDYSKHLALPNEKWNLKKSAQEMNQKTTETVY